MAQRPRNLLKSRAQRDSEVLKHLWLKSGQADSQEILNGVALAVGTTNTQVGLTAGEVVLNQTIVPVAAIASQALPAGAATSAGQFRKVLCEVDSSGALSYVVGNAVSTAMTDAVLPAGDPTHISIGWIEVTGAFVVGTTVVTTGILKPVLYHA